MLFNSLEFGLFFLVVYGLYLVLPHRWQNRMLFVASYIFYGAWDWRFLSLLLSSTLLDYVCALKIDAAPTPRRRKRWLLVAIIGNLTILGFFKYYNFFAENLGVLLGVLGIHAHWRLLHVILPVGISFYTFQTMSYTIDVYRKQLRPTKRFLDFALFVSFFPQLVAGPIERARNLLPQVLAPRRVTLEGFYDGCYLIFWGLFQKAFIADNIAKIVDTVFGSPGPYNGVLVLIALYAFAFQVYCDFAGYSDIARGLGKCMGFEIMVNFRWPYFSTNPVELWSRWHISLTTWVRDYLYLPLNRGTKNRWRIARNLMITMLLMGLWHGASWTFVAWGAYHAVWLIFYMFVRRWSTRLPTPSHARLAGVWSVASGVACFHLWSFSGLFFRGQSLSQAWDMWTSLIALRAWTTTTVVHSMGWQLCFYLWPLLLVQWLQRKTNDEMIVLRWSPLARTGWYYVCTVLFMLYGVYGAKEFIYFQF